MNFADIRRKFSGDERAALADPSRAFGSEAEMMEALRRQEFTPPKPRPTAAEIMGSIRQRFTRPAEDARDRIPRDESAARTYAPEAMAQPEWENPFTAPEKPKKPARDVPVYETVGGDMPFERRSAPAYAPQGYDPYGGYAAPYPPTGYAPYASAAPCPPQDYASPAYGAPYYDPYAAPAYDPRYNAPYPPNGYYAPQPMYPPYPPQGYAPAPDTAYATQPEYAAPGYGADFYGGAVPAPEGYPAPPYTGAPQPPAAAPKPKRKPLQGADLRYLLWSGSIVSGVLLTLVAFVYACTL